MERSKVMFKRIGVLLACIGILSYTVFHIVSLFASDLSTIVVGESTQETRIGFDGYVFRDEYPVTAHYGGAVDYVAYDGLKVSSSETLAYVYERGNSADVSNRIEVIDRNIALLEASLEDKSLLSDLPDLNAELRDIHTDMMKRLACGEFRGLRESIDKMTSQMDKIASVTGKEEVVKNTLAALVSEREGIIAAGGDKQEIKSDRSGYFYSRVDGYEQIFTTSSADTIDVNGFEALVSAEPSETSAIGKMTYDTEWRFVATLSALDGERFVEGETYELIFTGNGDVVFPLTLLRKVADVDSETVMLVFFCDRAPSDFSFERFQSVEAVVESVSGITVPKACVHRSGGEYYVYILNGSVVLERRLMIIHDGRDHYTVANGAFIDHGEGKPYLKANDVLILDGNNLFDGRIID
jgi:hypothetical protein